MHAVHGLSDPGGEDGVGLSVPEFPRFCPRQATEPLVGVLDDLLSKKGKAEDYSFLEEYTAKFNEILGEEYTDEEKLFCDCCYYVWYTEYEAKRYEWYSNNSGLLNYLYVGKADRYRKYADTLYDMLTSAKSDTDLRNIKIYCIDHKIITDN